jgi:hypothetical protein
MTKPAPAPRFAGVPFTLGGQAYVVPPLSLGAIEEFEAAIEGFEAMPTMQQLRFVVDLAHRALRRNYPELQRAELAELIDIGNAFALFATILQVAGLIRVEADDEGKAQATASGGTGSLSTPTSPPVSAGPSSTAANT